MNNKNSIDKEKYSKEHIELNGGFTLIELVVVMAIIAVLVLLAGPRLLGYTERAQLRRIQYDVKVMEGKVAEIASNTPMEITEWDDNEKNLSLLAMTERLYEEKGLARSIDRTTLDKVDLASNDELYIPEITSDKYRDYKIIPQDIVKDIRSTLPGTFYANYDGKVYYEHEKPLSRATDMADYECTAQDLALPYEFDTETNTITKYHHEHKDATKHLVIPSKFNVDGVCYPVLNIGKGAFMVGDYFHIVIPEGVKTIHPEAFGLTDLTETIVLPRSMREFHAGNGFKNIIVTGKPGDVVIHDKGNANVSYTDPSTGVARDYEYTINSGGNNKEGSVTIHEYTGKDKVITVPPYIEKDGIEYPVEVIEEGAYQGKGLISVDLPEGLKRIEDYAFARNQLIEVNIPKSVEHVGHYAFAFNEVYRGDWATSKDRIPTIKSISILSEGARERYDDLDFLGNIVGNDITYDAKTKETLVGTTKLLRHVFIQDITSNAFDIVSGEKPQEDNIEEETTSPNIKTPIEFDGVSYEDVGLVPESSDGWFEYTLVNVGTADEGYRVDGFSQDIKTQNNGEVPTDISIPSTFNGRPVVEVAEGSNRGAVFTGVRTLIIPDTVKRIGREAFERASINTLHIGNSVEHIGDFAFRQNNIQTLILPDSVGYIGNRAFDGNKLSEVTLPKGVRLASDNVFQYNGPNSNSGGISSEEHRPKGTWTLDNTNNWVNNSADRNGESPVEWFRFTKMNDGYRLDSFTPLHHNIAHAKSFSSLSIPSYVNGIPVVEIRAATNRGTRFSDVEELVIPDTVKRIGQHAFDESGINTLHIGNSVEHIDSFAFYRNNIQTLVLPESVGYIGNRAFDNNKLSEVILPNNVRLANNRVFQNNGPNSNSNGISPSAPNLGGRWTVIGNEWTKQ